MPEEINRVLTDRLSDLLLCPSEDAVDNLEREGIDPERITLVGNTMIDSLLRLLEPAKETLIVERLGLEERSYVLVTLHRPALVDDPDLLDQTMAVLAELARELPVVLPLHPRTRDRLHKQGRFRSNGLRFLEPLSYLEFIALEAAARLVITDSGGVQEETTVLGVPCVTYRTTTERPITVEHGTNRVIGTDPGILYRSCAEELRDGARCTTNQIPLWDGRAGIRAAERINEFLENVPTV
jgi:UDP-N-acetylglucosamine 2-epimerase (non-hydrolysing)